MATITRKDFIKRLWGVVFLPYALFLILMTKKHIDVTAPKEIRLPLNQLDGVSFLKEIICVNDAAGLKVYSSTCTHLGCRIDKMKDNKFICPCHGSSFDLEGKVLSGPASKNLDELNYTIDKEQNELIIKI